MNLIPYGARRHIKDVPGLASFQRFLVGHFMSGVPFIHKINGGPAAGLNFEVTLPTDKGIWAGTYESDFANAIAAGVSPGDVCYDIGGYRGYMSAAMALSGASSVFVFEPLPANQDSIRRLNALNPNLPITLLRMAVGASNDIMALKIMPEQSMAKLEISSFQKNAPSLDEIDVAVRTIDSLVEAGELPIPNLLKIDVEGAEVDVLQGASGVIKAHRPILFLEIHSESLEHDCLEILEKFDYKVRRLGVIPASSDDVRHFACMPRAGEQ